MLSGRLLVFVSSVSVGLVSTIPLEANSLTDNSVASKTYCRKEGQIFEEGEKWMMQNFRYRCLKYGFYEILGCITADGHELEPGETYVKHKIMHECVGKPNGAMWYGWRNCDFYGAPPCQGATGNKTQLSMEAIPPTRPLNETIPNPAITNGTIGGQPVIFVTKCSKDGKTYKEGEQWTAGNFRYKCLKYGGFEITGCVTDDGHELSRGEHYTANNIVHECKGTEGGVVHYGLKFCGILNTPACS